MVLGRNQYRIDPIGGKNRLLSGPNPQPSPTTSNSIVKNTAFWKTIGSAYQEATSVKPSMPRGAQHDQPRDEDVQQDLDDVEQVHHDRRAEADLGPVPRHRDDPLGAGALAPLRRNRRRARPA